MTDDERRAAAEGGVPGDEGEARMDRVRRLGRATLRAGRLAAGAVRRHPGAALVLAAVLVVVLPLAHDLFFAIPWPVRKAGGWVVVLAGTGAALGRLWIVRTSDDVPPVERPAPSASGRAWALALPVACGLMAVPLLAQPAEDLGFGDWDFFLGKFEAARRTILEWGQFPWWDPWARGGFPLAADAQCGLVGVALPLVLAFGTSVGMRLATVACFLIAAEGARRLARLWLDDPMAAVAAGLIYALNGGVLVMAVAGYHLVMCYGALPWLLFHTFRLDRRPIEGAALGAWLAFNVLNGIQYWSVYNGLAAGVAWIRMARVRGGPARRRLLTHSLVALGVFFALAGWRLATTARVNLDYPRVMSSTMAETPWTMLIHLLGRPGAETWRRMQIPYFWETACYLGPVVVVLAAASLARGWRWWHTLTLVAVALGAGGTSWIYPSYWLGHLPLFSTMHVVTRWRFVAVLGVALAVADELADWRRRSAADGRWAALALGLIAADYLSYGLQLLGVGFSIPPTAENVPGPPVARIVQVRDALGFAAVQRGYGVISALEPMLGYDQHAPTARLWRGHPDYIGEHWTDAGPVVPAVWSPNRLVFRVAPGEVVHINQNPGSWWWSAGRPAFPGWRCAETLRPFAVRADDRGLVELRIRPRWLDLGLALHGVGVALVAVAWLAGRRDGRRSFRVSTPDEVPMRVGNRGRDPAP